MAGWGGILFGLIFTLMGCFIFAIPYLEHKTAPEDYIAALLPGFMFLTPGLFVLVNSLATVLNMDKLPRALSAVTRFLSGMHMLGITVCLVGMFPLLMGLGVIPDDQDSMNAPPWVVAIAGGVFVLGGLYIIVSESIPGKAGGILGLVRSFFYNFTGLLIITAFALIAGWIGFGPGEREFTETVSLPAGDWSDRGGVASGRFVFGISAVFLAIVSGIGWFNVLSGRWKPPRE